MVSKDHKLSVRRKCVLLTRSNQYYQPEGDSIENLLFVEVIDKQLLETLQY